mgnify:CR=1 FL=1
MKGKTMILSSLVLLLAVQTSCQENEFGTIDLTMPEEVYVLPTTSWLRRV